MLVTAYPFFIFTTPLGIIDAVVLARRTQRGKAIGHWECFWDRQAEETADLWELARIVKGGRTEERIGTEQRLIDNSKSSSRLVRKFKISREWSYSCFLEHEHANATVDTTTLQIKDGMTKQRSVEESLRDKVGYTFESKQTYEEDVQVEVQPFKAMSVHFHWKNILELGTIVLRNQHGVEVELPFSIVVGITFDQAQSEK